MSTDIRNWSPGGQFYVSPDTRKQISQPDVLANGFRPSPQAACRREKRPHTTHGVDCGFRIRSTSNLPSIARSRDLKGRTSRGTSGLAPSRIRFGQVRREAAPAKPTRPSAGRISWAPEPQVAGGVASHLPRGSAAR